MILKKGCTSLFIILCSIFASQNIIAQTIEFDDKENPEVIKELPSPKKALLLSFVAPGLGHHYVDKTNWTIGKIHLGSEIALLVGYLGLRIRANSLEGNLTTLARSKAGVSLSDKGRKFELAVADFDNLAEYNDYQLRSRRWQNILPNTPENNWNWETDEARFEFQDTRDRIGRSENQLPALVSLMVVNRLLSGIGAFTKARNMISQFPEARVSYLNEYGNPGITAHLRVSF